MDSTRKPHSDTGKINPLTGKKFEPGAIWKRNSTIHFYGLPSEFSAAHDFTQTLLTKIELLPRPMLRFDWDAMSIDQRTEYLYTCGLCIFDARQRIGDDTYIEFERKADRTTRYDKRGRRYT
jgi:hypothetical protein